MKAPPATPLRPDELTHVDRDMAEALLGYLNLPPVGCIADEVHRGGGEHYEVPEGVRRAVLGRRGPTGRFSSLGQLAGIEGFTRRELDTILGDLGNIERYGNRVSPVWGGPEANKALFELLESAASSIHISTYIVGGQTGVRLARLLADKKRQGVEVRLMFCATGLVISGSPSGTGFVSRFSELRSWLVNDSYVRKRIVEELRAGGVPFINNVPIGRHWRRRDLRALGVVSAGAYERWARRRGIPDDWLQEQALIDSHCTFGFANVDHRKMVIVDGCKAFIGSQNLADSYLYDNELDPSPAVNRRNWQWHDNSAILEGGAVRRLNRLFAMRWMLSGGDVYDWNDSHHNPGPRRAGHAAVAVEATIPGGVTLPWSKNWKGFLATLAGFDVRPVSEGANPIKDRLLGLPLLAGSDLYVEHCYPSDASLLTEWARIARRVPKFHMVVPHHYDADLLGNECDRYYPELARAGIRLHGYDRAILHSKILVMDGYYVATGSYNLTLRSSRADLECEFFIQCADYGRAVRDRIRGDLELCTPIVPDRLDRFRSRRSIPIIDAIVRYLFL